MQKKDISKHASRGIGPFFIFPSYAVLARSSDTVRLRYVF